MQSFQVARWRRIEQIDIRTFFLALICMSEIIRKYIYNKEILHFFREKIQNYLVVYINYHCYISVLVRLISIRVLKQMKATIGTYKINLSKFLYQVFDN